MATTRPPTTRKPPARRVAGDFDEPSRAPNKSENAELKRRAKSQDQELADVYEAGRKEGQAAGGKGSGSAAGSKKSTARRPVPGARSARTAARQLQAPVRAQLVSGMRIFGLTLAVVALYDVLTGPGPDAFSGVVGGVAKGLHWLGSPIPIPKRS